MPSDSSPLHSNQIEDVASIWVARTDRGLSPAETRERNAWLAADPRHIQAYHTMQQSWDSLAGAHGDETMVKMADAVLTQARARRSRHAKVVRYIVPLAAAAAVAVMTWWHTTAPSAPNTPPVSAEVSTYKVLAGDSKRVVLPDGSVALLNGDSRIATDYTADERRITLLHGEAHFTVMPNVHRPFHVTAGNITVRAVGTAFNVKLDTRSIEVLVTEGNVTVDDLDRGTPVLDAEHSLLVAGQKITVTKNDDTTLADQVTPVSLLPVEIERNLSWQSTRLAFDDTPLAEVIEAFNTYNSHRLVLQDARLHSRRITGVFRADNVDGFVRLLEAGADVSSSTGKDGVTLLHARR